MFYNFTEGSVNVPQVVLIDGCESFSCDLSVGQTVNVQLEFVSPSNAATVQAVSKVGQESSTAQACGNGLNCPLQAGEYYVHKGSFTVGKSSVSSKSMTYQLKSEDQTLVCFTFPITVA